MEKFENKEIKVSVYCLAYNHEKYIRDALEGFVMQKTNFKFEVIVHDDASTDGTADIIREYEKKYPDIIKPIYQTENQYKKGILKIKTYMLPITRGKYIAFCEGDDYWTDENKLQIQYDIMENNPECIFCTHKTGVLHIDNLENKQNFPDDRYNLTDGFIDKTTLLDIALFSLLHLTSWFVRKDFYQEYQNNRPEFSLIMPTGDNPFLIYMSSIGKTYYINRKMSVYRKGTEGSWTSRVERTKDIDKKLMVNKKFQDALTLCKDYFPDKKDKELIEKAIHGLDVERAVLIGDYDFLLSPENRRNMTKKVVVWLYLNKYLPYIARLIRKLKIFIKNS